MSEESMTVREYLTENSNLKEYLFKSDKNQLMLLFIKAKVEWFQIILS